MTELVDISQEPIVPTEEESVIDSQTQENYRNWKQNSIHLYDYLLTFNSIWPSLTVQFFPDKDYSNSISTYRLLTSLYTTQDFDNFLQISSFNVKDPEVHQSNSSYDETLQEYVSSFHNNQISIDQKFKHLGDVNKSRYLPQNPDLITTINNVGDLYLFDKTKHPSFPDEFKYDIKLNGHKKEGFGLSWNNNREGVLLTSSMDGTTKKFDLNKYDKNEEVLKEVKTYETDDNGTNDVSWNPLHDSIFGTVGESNEIRIYDDRNDEIIKSNKESKYHSGGINSISFNFENSFILSTGDSNGKLNVWDLRYFETPIWSFDNAHDGSISSIQFNPKRTGLLASSSFDDPIVKIWDLSKGELIFKHGGHLLGVNDISWNPNDDLMISSVSNDNTIQIWKPSEEILSR